MEKAFNPIQILFFKQTTSLILLFLGSSSYAADAQTNKKPTLTCEYGWQFAQDANEKIEGSLHQSIQKVSVLIEENYISLLEKNNTFQGSNMIKVFNNLPNCKKT